MDALSPWAKEVDRTKSEYTCKETLLLMCRSYGIREEDYKPLCAQDGRGPCLTPPNTSNALCVFEAMLEAGVRFPLHKFYGKVLTRFGVAPSQLSPNTWRCLVGFVLLCESIGVRPMFDVFRHYFKLRSNGIYGFYRFDPCSKNHDCRLFKINGRLPFNEGWRKKFFFLESNTDKSWGCPREWGTPRKEAYAKLNLTEVAKTVISKLEMVKAKKDIDPMDLLDKSRYQNSYPICPPMLVPVKAERNHDEAAASASTQPQPTKREGNHDEAAASASTQPQPKRMCLAPASSPITGGTPPCQLALPMSPSPQGFPPIPVGLSRTGNDDEGGEPSMSLIVCKLIQDGEAELRHTKHQLMVKKAEHAKTLGVAAEMKEELKVLQASHAQLMTKVERLTKQYEAVETEHRLKVHNLMVDLKAEEDKKMAKDHQFSEELEALKGQHAAQIKQLQEAHAAEKNTINQQWQHKVINSEHMSSTVMGRMLSARYAKGLRDMRDLAIMVYPDADPALLTPEVLAATPVPPASPFQVPMEVDHQ